MREEGTSDGVWATHAQQRPRGRKEKLGVSPILFDVFLPSLEDEGTAATLWEREAGQHVRGLVLSQHPAPRFTG